MAIAVDNAGVASGGMGNLSFVLGGGSNRIVVVTTATVIADITNVTFNGVNMTFLDDQNTASGRAEIWYMLEANLPVAGTYTIAVTGGESDGAKGAQSFTGVDQITPFGTTFKTTSATGPPSVNVTGTATTDVVIDAASIQEPASLAAGAGQTEAYKVGSGGVQNCTVASSREPGNGGTVTMSWGGTADDSVAVAVAIKEAAAPAPPSERSRPLLDLSILDAQDEGRFNELDVRNWL